MDYESLGLLNEAESLLCFGEDLKTDNCLLLSYSVFIKIKDLCKSLKERQITRQDMYLGGMIFSSKESKRTLCITTDILDTYSNDNAERTIVGKVLFLTAQSYEQIRNEKYDEQESFLVFVNINKGALSAYKGTGRANCLIIKPAESSTYEEDIEGYEDHVIHLPAIDSYLANIRKRKQSFKVKGKIDSFEPESVNLSDYVLFMNDKTYREKYKSDNVLFITPNALKAMDQHIHWGETTEENLLEQGGYMIGAVFTWNHIYYVFITDIFPFEEEVSNKSYFEGTYESFADVMMSIRSINEDTPIRKYRIGTYHTHPGNLAVFMSGTDKTAQKKFSPNDWQFSVVINPQRRIIKAYNGYNSDEAKCVLLIDENQDESWATKFKREANCCIGWNKWRFACNEAIPEKKEGENRFCDIKEIQKSVLEHLRTNYEYSFWINRYIFVFCSYVCTKDNQPHVKRFDLIGIYDKHGIPFFANKTYTSLKQKNEKIVLLFVYSRGNTEELVNHFAFIKTDYYMFVERPDLDIVKIIGERNGF